MLRGVFQLDRGSPIFDHPQKFGIRSMKPSDYPDKNILSFECGAGMNRREVFDFFRQVVPYLRSFNPIADQMGKLREHGILIYSRHEGRIDPRTREFPPCPVEPTAAEAATTSSAGVVQLEVVDARAQGPAEPAPEPTRGERLPGSLLTRSVLKLGRGLRTFRKPRVRRNLERHPDYEVIEVPLILTDEHCAHLIELARQRMSLPDDESPPSLPTHVKRRSVAFLDSDATIVDIKQRLASLTGAVVERQERIQVARYGPMEYYAPHRDASGDPGRDTGPGGNREQTVIVFLNDDFDGGTIHFPEIGQEIVPEKGKAVIVSNLSEDGEPHPLSLYSHDAVLGGEKWVCSQWIRERPVAQAAAAASPSQAPHEKRPSRGKRRSGKAARKRPSARVR